jgi:hypothetical protein
MQNIYNTYSHDVFVVYISATSMIHACGFYHGQGCKKLIDNFFGWEEFATLSL